MGGRQERPNSSCHATRLPAVAGVQTGLQAQCARKHSRQAHAAAAASSAHGNSLVISHSPLPIPPFPDSLPFQCNFFVATLPETPAQMNYSVQSNRLLRCGAQVGAAETDSRWHTPVRRTRHIAALPPLPEQPRMGGGWVRVGRPPSENDGDNDNDTATAMATARSSTRCHPPRPRPRWARCHDALAHPQ